MESGMTHQSAMQLLVARLGADDREAFEERAGIMQFDGKLPREQAECLALVEVLGRNPAALLGITVLEIELDGGTQWLLTTDLAYARQYLKDIEAKEIGVQMLDEVLADQYGGVAVLTTLG